MHHHARAQVRATGHGNRMSQQTTIRKLAQLVNTPVEKLLEQLAEAGMPFSGPDQAVTSTEKVKLLGFLRRTHGKAEADRKSTRLNSSHVKISYAVFCLKKKNKNKIYT